MLHYATSFQEQGEVRFLLQLATVSEIRQVRNFVSSHFHGTGKLCQRENWHVKLAGDLLEATRDILAMSPWVADDPITSDPSLLLTDRRKLLYMMGKGLQPGGPYTSQYRESAIWANMDVPVDSGY